MKVIDLINKVANGEEVPEKIIYEGEIYTFREDLNDYENEYPDFEEGIDKYKYLFEDPYGKDYKEFFNDSVKIIEEDKKIENIGTIYFNETPTEAILHRKIEEIIDYINKEKNNV